MAGTRTDDSARRDLEQIIATCDEIASKHRRSSEWIRWEFNAISFLEAVFGPESRYATAFRHIPWAHTGTIAIDPDEMRRDHSGYAREGVNDFISRKHQEAAKSQLGEAKGILQAALDELLRVGVSKVYNRDAMGDEAAASLRVVKLLERQWRKTIRDKPAKEKQVQESF
jgi:hypothetical protein